jgi:hypothetical protein
VSYRGKKPLLQRQSSIELSGSKNETIRVYRAYLQNQIDLAVLFAADKSRAYDEMRKVVVFELKLLQVKLKIFSKAA